MLMLSIAPYYSLYKIIINNMLLVFFYNSKCKKLCFISYVIQCVQKKKDYLFSNGNNSL